MRYFFNLIILFSFLEISAQPISEKQLWVNESYNNLTLDERLGQLFMVAVYPNTSADANKEQILKLIQEQKIGGAIYMKAQADMLVRWNNEFQQKSKIPLLTSIDGEWGVSMRVENTVKFPRQLTLGAIRNRSLIYEMGRIIAQQCKRLGIYVDFAPDVDVNTNANNPVINDRSFGEDKLEVALRGLEYALGLQAEGVMACAKHFPGHGDTDKDSHKTLPVINHSRERLEDVEFFPFKILKANGVQSAMVAHLNAPVLDLLGKPSSISKAVITDVLKGDLGFKGIVYTDALNMKGVSENNIPGILDAEALEAGNDVLLFSQNVPKAIEQIKLKIEEGKITEAQIEQSVKKILASKYNAGLNRVPRISEYNILADINTEKAYQLREKLFEQSITVAANEENVLPISNACHQCIAVISIGSDTITRFQQEVSEKNPVKAFNLGKNFTQEEVDAIVKNLEVGFDAILISVHGMTTKAATNYGLSNAELAAISKISEFPNVVLILFGNPYSLKNFDKNKNVLVAYEENEVTQEAATEIIFGMREATGKLPVTASEKYPVHTGIQLKYKTDEPLMLAAKPEDVKLSSVELNEIDGIANELVNAKAAPGCQIVVARKGRVVYNKTFGTHSYENKQPVKKTDVYDVASVTKIMATTLVAMKLYEEGKLDLDEKIKEYITLDKKSTIRNVTVKQILLHEAGFVPFIPFYLDVIKDRNTYLSSKQTESFSVPVAENLWARNDYPDSMWYAMSHSKLNTSQGFKYSDLSMYTMQKVLESVLQEPLNEYVRKHFYEPMGLTRTMYNPLKTISKNEIIPTEWDKLFRQQQVQGFVHDPGAALYGGVAGHAGLFSTAEEMAALGQMLLNKGVFDGVRYLDEETIQLFTTKQSKISRRGFGFDKQETNGKEGPTCSEASPLTYGHTGFTGTCVWVDPSEELVFVFLSNRVCPDVENKKLVSGNYRTRIQSQIYKAIRR